MALTELENSRDMVQTKRGYQGVKVYECLMSEITQTSAAGWIGVGITLPAVGDAWGLGTWTSKVQPRCNNVRVRTHRPSLRKATIIATFFAPRVFGG